MRWHRRSLASCLTHASRLADVIPHAVNNTTDISMTSYSGIGECFIPHRFVQSICVGCDDFKIIHFRSARLKEDGASHGVHLRPRNSSAFNPSTGSPPPLNPPTSMLSIEIRNSGGNDSSLHQSLLHLSPQWSPSHRQHGTIPALLTGPHSLVPLRRAAASRSGQHQVSPNNVMPAPSSSFGFPSSVTV
jgi:hypothetical protein